jgi:dipeptidyl aminopeptidase/acylaminoacyl peptidase
MSGSVLGLEDLPAIRSCGVGNWAPDGQSIGFYWADRNGELKLWVVGADGGGPRRVADSSITLERPEGTDRRDVLGGPQWSPIGQEFAVTRPSSSGTGETIWILHRSGTLRELAMRAGDDYRTPRWAPDGSRLACVRNRDGRDDIVVIEPEGGISRQITYDRWDNTDLEWSPDGKFIAYISQRGDVDLFSNSICVVPANGGDPTCVTDSKTANDRSPRWSPDGNRIVFVSNRDGGDNLWSIRPDGSGATRLTVGLNDKSDPRWSPDGSWILYTLFNDCGVNIVAVSTDGSLSRDIAVGGVNRAPRWSPDGQSILYHRAGPDEPGDLWIRKWDSDFEEPSWQLTDVAGTALDGVVFSRPSVISYESKDGVPIQALLYRPPESQGRRGPGVVYVRGGPNAVTTNGWLPQIQYLAQRGFAVIVPNYRGSTGYGRSFMEMNLGGIPGGDIEDWLAAASYLRNLEDIDDQHVCIMGHSYGGYAALMMLGLHPTVFSAGVSIAGVSNWASCWEDAPLPWMRRLQSWLIGRPTLSPLLTQARSPVTYADHYVAPVLILQGERDPAVPPSQAHEMANRLDQLGKPHTVHIYSGEEHIFVGAEAIIDSTRRIEAFLRTNGAQQE